MGAFRQMASLVTFLAILLISAAWGWLILQIFLIGLVSPPSR
ncbi:MAG: hypothetical protein R3F24_11025 [Gammaproteobacteria bacterium]